MGDEFLLLEFTEEGTCAELGFHAGRCTVAAVGYGREEVLLPGLGVVEGREPHGGDAGVLLEDPQGLVLFVCKHGVVVFYLIMILPFPWRTFSVTSISSIIVIA